MKTSFAELKSMCQKSENAVVNFGTSQKGEKSEEISAFWGRLRNSFCDKESSHVIAKCRNSTFHRR